jgi:hypothetical protein
MIFSFKRATFLGGNASSQDKSGNFTPKNGQNRVFAVMNGYYVKIPNN